MQRELPLGTPQINCWKLKIKRNSECSQRKRLMTSRGKRYKTLLTSHQKQWRPEDNGTTTSLKENCQPKLSVLQIRWHEKFLQSPELPAVTPEDTDNLISPIYSKEIEFFTQNLHTKKFPGPDGFIVKFYQTLKKKKAILHKLFQKIEKEGTYLNIFWGPG